MTITTERYIDEPIIMVTFEGPLDEAQIDEMHEELLEYCQQLGICYVVLDMTGADSTLHEGLALVLAEPLLVLMRDDQMHLALVGTPVPDEAEANIPYPTYADRRAALQDVRQRIASRTSR